MARISQANRVLALLRQRGEAGTSALEWAAIPPDGATPIVDLAGVIRQLRQRGYNIESRERTTGNGVRHARYVLREPPSGVPKTSADRAAAASDAIRAARVRARGATT
jgi:hypothetical protein